MSRFVSPVIPAVPAPPAESECSYAMLVHLTGFLGYLLGPLGILVPLALWLARKDESGFIDDHGREALNYKITIWIYSGIASVLVYLGVGCVLLPALVIFDLVVVIVAATRARGGYYYRYPVTIRFIPS